MKTFKIVCEVCFYQGALVTKPPSTENCPQKMICPASIQCKTHCLLGVFSVVKPPISCPNCGSEDFVKLAEK